MATESQNPLQVGFRHHNCIRSESIPEAESARMQHFIDYLIEHSNNVPSVCLYQGDNYAVIVDPSRGEVVAEEPDDTALNPIGHAPMRCIATAAQYFQRHCGVEGERKRSAEQAELDQQQYLCSGLEVYVVVEPCAM